MQMISKRSKLPLSMAQKIKYKFKKYYTYLNLVYINIVPYPQFTGKTSSITGD